MLHRLISFLLVVLFIFSAGAICFAQTPPAGQEISGQEKTREILEKEKELKEKIEKPKEVPQIEEKIPEEAVAPAVPTQKILVQKINVIGVTILSDKEVNNIILPFQNKELNLREMQKVADLITDAYRKRGYITSRAYLPPQKIEQATLEIRVLEATMGDMQIKGNRFYKAKLFKKKITLKKGDPFNYNALKKDLVNINKHPDRNARAVLAPGKEAGATDVVLEVKDNLPIHAGFAWDNFGSRYVNRNRYTTTITANNLVGWDDILTLQYQLADAEDYMLTSLRYLIPVTNTLDLGFFVAKSKLALGREYEDVMSRGKSKLYSIYATQYLIREDNFILDISLGFDYKDIFNFLLGNENSRDRLRVAKLGLNLDITDNFGRTLIINELNCGIPDIMGGLQEQDAHASRAGSGGKFVKDNLNLLRLQKMPFNSQLLWKNQLQFSPYILTAAEQFQVGGVANVRGYPPAEYVGDKGYAMTWEWSFPPYFVPKKLKVPLSKGKVYDAFRVIGFYDWANVRLRRPQAGEEENKTLRAAGCGIRFNLPENFSARIEFGWPLDNNPSDGKHLHKWVEVSKKF